MTDVIILANGSVNEKLPFLNLQKKCPALIPVHTRPLIFYVLDFYKDKPVDQIHLVISSDYVHEISPIISTNNINIISCPPTKGVNDTLKFVSKNHLIQDDIIINLVTTIPTAFPSKGEIQIGNRIREFSIGSGVSLKNDIIDYIYKKNSRNKSNFPFTGVFRVDKENLINALSNTLICDDLLRVVHELSKNYKLNFKKCDWIDCGHEISFYEAKEKLLQSRSFNTITVSSPLGVLTKNSTEVIKLKNEYDYIKSLPKDLEILFPRLVSDFTKSEDYGSYAMEYYGYSNLAEYQLFWNLEYGQWAKIFDSVQKVLCLLSNFKYDLSYKDYMSFYFNKTVERVTLFQKFAELNYNNYLNFNGRVIVNGTECDSFFNLIDDIKERISLIYDSNQGSIMHGDFCFNNILYDISSGTIRLIDQRGSYGQKKNGIWGDSLYDYAKFAHSSIGMYDYLANGMFEFNKDNQNFSIKFFSNDNKNYLETLTSNLIEKSNFSLSDIKFTIGLLFVSMSPMHSDSFIKQSAMYLHGLKYINNSLHD